MLPAFRRLGSWATKLFARPDRKSRPLGEAKTGAQSKRASCCDGRLTAGKIPEKPSGTHGCGNELYLPEGLRRQPKGPLNKPTGRRPTAS